MTTYQRKRETIEALQFTADMGDELRESGQPHVNGLEYSEHTGYLYCGTRIAFGDYMVGSAVVPRDIFEARWEPVPVPLSIAEAERVIVHGRDVVEAPAAPAKPLSALADALSEVPSHVKPKATRKRTEPSE
jgi:hypothetical protein